jgi:AraC-like DNA-binding protein
VLFYVRIDVHAEDQSDYDGFIREVQFGPVVLESKTGAQLRYAVERRQHAVWLTEIAYLVCFSSSSHFSTMFRRKFGMRPSDVRRKV